MAKRIQFTTRDWMWLCVVFALAFGWGGHFRYSAWLEEHLAKERPPDLTVEQIKTALNEETKRAEEFRLENARLNYAIRKALSRELQDDVKRAKPDWRQVPYDEF